MVAIIPALASLSGVVERRGYRHSHTVYVMEAERLPVNRGPFLPEGLGWTDAAAADAPGYYDAMLDAFHNHPDVNIPPYETFQQSLIERLGSIRLLKEGADVVGFVRFAMDSDTSGRIELLGRVSRCRGRGLGIHILQEALVQLCRRGAKRLQLEVVSSSPAALRLYESAGFRVVGTVDRFIKVLRSS